MSEAIVIQPPKFETVVLSLVGTAPLMQNKFSSKAKAQMQADQEAGKTSKSKKERVAKDFEQLAKDACYKDKAGWYGINAACFRNAAISACRLVGYKMTLAKLSIFIEADGFDEAEGTPLVRLIASEPETSVMPARNATGVIDLRPRPMWREWGCELRVRYDAGQFSRQDVVNLFSRVGMQGGIGEGRPDSKQSAGLGFGLFRIE